MRYFFCATLFALCTIAGTCHRKFELDPYLLMVVDDFENSAAIPWQHDDNVLYSHLEYITDARVGQRAARIRLAGEKGAYRWTDLYRAIPRWPEGGEAVTFWARADKPADIYVTLNEKMVEADKEQWGAKVHLTTEWEQYWVPLGAFTQRLMGGPRGNNQLDLFAVYGVGFAECLPDWPVQFDIDQLQIERRRSQ